MATRIERWQDGYVLLVQDRLNWVRAGVFRTWELAWQYANKEFASRPI